MNYSERHPDFRCVDFYYSCANSGGFRKQRKTVVVVRPGGPSARWLLRRTCLRAFFLVCRVISFLQICPRSSCQRALAGHRLLVTRASSLVSNQWTNMVPVPSEEKRTATTGKGLRVYIGRWRYG